jgi:ectoine hydroxylase-related dioxygenase (phytanoyl-CoA dioxygenase family)
LGAALDEDFVVGAFGVVCSLPNAPTQHRHSDGGILFPNSGIDRLLPSAAITVGIPLIEMNEIHGTTALWPGTHHDISRMEGQAIEPVIREGSLVLWDFRLKHSGTPNGSRVVRPLLYLTYCRPWWVDHGNFQKKTLTPLRARKASLLGLSERHQRLLARAEEF